MLFTKLNVFIMKQILNFKEIKILKLRFWLNIIELIPLFWENTLWFMNTNKVC